MTTKEKKKPDYVAGLFNIEYSMPQGLVGMLAVTSKKPEQEVWCIISECCNVCAFRLSKKEKQQSSWTEEMFPDTNIQLKIEMQRDSGRYDYKTGKYTLASDKLFCSIELGFTEEETFSQAQVNNYITEKFLLGDDEIEENRIE